MYRVRKDTIHHIIQKLKHRRFRRLLPCEQRFLFAVVCLFVFSYKVLRVACHQLLVFC